ncbi:hypothetical protein AFERRI_560072 [Acidithiobacillus ferrivorans]|uniref:Uncharacterized protein n=2 Tax=Acidithiobacillus ferrivorans TaxID=160808 RepID=A0A060UXV6_9PROT|nr:hypothetical protein AFERRI_560072 [Acidithiobacillus ferrivorans]
MARTLFCRYGARKGPLPFDLGGTPACPVTGMYGAVLCPREPLFYGEHPRCTDLYIYRELFYFVLRFM